MKRRKSREEPTEMISIDTPGEVVGVFPSRSAEAPLRGPRTAALALLGVYLAASGFVIVMSHPGLAVAHAAGIVVAIWGCVDRRPVARTVGDLLPLFVAPMLYGEVPLLIGALGSSYHDVRVQN